MLKNIFNNIKNNKKIKYNIYNSFTFYLETFNIYKIRQSKKLNMLIFSNRESYCITKTIIAPILEFIKCTKLL